MKSFYFLILCLPLGLLSCGTFKPVRDPASRHLLDPDVPYRAGHSSSPSVAIARPALPAYLDRQQLVTRDGTGAIRVLDENLWSEPLDSGIARVTAANLSRLTGSTSILPVGDFITLDYKSILELRVAQFDPEASGAMVLECTWRVQPVKGGDTNFRSFRTEVPVTPTIPPMSGRISAMNEALERLARDIARSL